MCVTVNFRPEDLMNYPDDEFDKLTPVETSCICLLRILREVCCLNAVVEDCTVHAKSLLQHIRQEEKLPYSVVGDPRVPFRLCLQVVIDVRQQTVVFDDYATQALVLLRSLTECSQVPAILVVVHHFFNCLGGVVLPSRKDWPFPILISLNCPNMSRVESKGNTFFADGRKHVMNVECLSFLTALDHLCFHEDIHKGILFALFPIGSYLIRLV